MNLFEMNLMKMDSDGIELINFGMKKKHYKDYLLLSVFVAPQVVRKIRLWEKPRVRLDELL